MIFFTSFVCSGGKRTSRSQELRISNEDATKVDETVLGRFLSAYASGSIEYRVFMNSDESGQTLTDRVFDRQCAIIRKLAEEGPGIFVGRCADYVLGDYTNCINTFIYAYKDDRIRRIMKLYKLDEKQAADKVKKTDRERKNYYEARTGRTWGSIEANAMMFNTSLLGIDGAVDALEAIYKNWAEREA